MCNCWWSSKSISIRNENWIIPHEGNTFHARDIFAPFAAGYASGQLQLEDFGPELDLEDLKQYLIPLTDVSDEIIKGEILYVDHYGNGQTNVSPQELKDKGKSIGDVLNLKIDNQELQAKWCPTYQNETIGGVGLVTDSWGMISIFLSNGDAQKLLNYKDGSKIEIKF